MLAPFDSTSCLSPGQESEPFSPVSKLEGEEESGSHHLTDVERLRMLGYDAALSRPLGFWSSAAMTLCHMSFVYDFIALAGCYAYDGPLLFIIGYPCLAMLNLILLGPFAELASAFPVSGAMATWAWRCARGGVRKERHWGYLTSGIVLAGHLGKTISVLYHVATSMTQLYILMADVPHNPLTLTPTDPKAWWDPVFHCIVVSVVALVILSRGGRSAPFWIGAGLLNIVIGIMFIGFIVAAGYKDHKASHLGFPGQARWRHSFSYMMFMGVPLRPVGIDCSAHMAEETKDASVSVPRAMYSATILHFVFTYVLVVLYIFYLTPKAGPLNVMVTFAFLLGFNTATIYTLAIIVLIVISTQVVASVLVTTRFIFALARDRGLPFSTLLKQTAKDGEPWMADLALFVALYLSSTGYLNNTNRYCNLIQTFGLWFVSVAYIIPLSLYLFSNLDLQYMDRTQFTLRKWSKPMTAVSIAWLILCFIQACFPVADWNNYATSKLKTGSLNSFPFVVLGMLALMAMSWWLYGSRNYIGPIIAMTKHTAGIEINPYNFATATGRANAIESYIKEEMRQSASPLQLLTRSRLWPKSPTTSSGSVHKSPTSSQMPGVSPPPTMAPNRAHLSARPDKSVIHESMAFPMSLLRSTQASRDEEMEHAQAESQALPQTTVLQTPTVITHGPSSDVVVEGMSPPTGPTRPSWTFKRGKSRMSNREWDVAQMESQLEPPCEEEPALLESQLDPTAADSWGPNGPPMSTVSTGKRQSHPHPLAYGQENFGESEDSFKWFSPMSLPVPPKRR